MTDSPAIEPEREVQHQFRKIELLQTLILFLAVLLMGRWIAGLPDRTELGLRSVALRAERLPLEPRKFAPLRLAGAWRLTSADPRFGGVSALALDGERLLALTDSGVLIRFPKPAAAGVLPAVITELPAGPGDPRFKRRRDSEALTRDPAGAGWWVAFENRHELWLYDRDFRRALRRSVLPRNRWRRNRGIEAAAATGAAVVVLPERGNIAVELGDATARVRAIIAPAGPISDAARLPTGELLVVNRRLTALGFSNSLAWLQPSGNGFRYTRRLKLPLSPLDNVEAVAAEPIPGGGTRLWLMTDDNFQRPMRTLLLALDLTSGR